jgi:hypothetical protein
VIGAAVVVAALLLVIVINIDTPTRRSAHVNTTVPPERVTDLISPERLTASDLAAADSGIEPTDIGSMAGGWIQTTNNDGELAQQYRFARLDAQPEGLPAGWLQMAKPEAEFYLNDGRVVTLSGDTALAYAPNRALESGTLTGNVVIQMFQEPDDPTADFRDGDAIVTVTTQEGSFDNILGEVRCDGWINLEHERISAPGRSLRVFMNDQEDSVRLELEHVDYVSIRTPPDEQVIGVAPSNASDKRQGTKDKTKSSDRPTRADKKKSATEGSPSAAPVQFYELTLHDSVLVRQGPPTAQRTVTGDRLRIMFSPDSQDLGPTLAIAPRMDRTIGSPTVPILVSLAIGTLNPPTDVPEPREDLTVITCTGSLTIEPMRDTSRNLESSEDAMLTIDGNPVLLTDAGEDAFAMCGELRYHALDEMVELIGSPSSPIEVDSPQFVGGGQHFFLSQARGIGGFTGAGWIEPLDDAPQEQATATNDILVDMRITWTEGVDLEFDNASDDDAAGTLRRATFNGNVEVLSPEGTIACQHLDLTLKPGSNGEPTPDTMVGTGDVKVSNPDQTLWADNLLVTFRDSLETETPTDDEQPDALLGSNANVKSLSANGNVQVLLADGSRAFADKLKGDAEQEVVLLTGSDVVIAADKLLIDQGSSVELRRRDGKASWSGPGQARIFSDPIRVDEDRRIERPKVDNETHPPRVKARWNEGMTYNNVVNDGAGRLVLQGRVDAHSEPSPTELSHMSGASLILDFAHADPDSKPVDSTGLDGLEGGERTLARMVAQGEAQLENRTWATDERLDVPRVFSVAGEHIDYDNRTRDANVYGAGEMLIRDLGDGEPEPVDEDLPFSGKGTTLFRWSRALEMTQVREDRFDIVMDGNVETLHQAIDDSTATLTSQRIEATVARTQTANDDALPVEPDPDTMPDDLIDFGGPMELRRIFGSGDVFVRTLDRDVSCQEFDYNLMTGIARLRGRIAVLTRGSGRPVNADSVLWNMRRDTITIEGAGGTTTQ